MPPLPSRQSSPLPPAVVVHGLAEAEAVLAAAGGRPVLLLSPRGAADILGPLWWAALAAAARRACPGAEVADVLDVGAAAGLAQAALAAGVGGIVFAGPAGQAARLASIAARAGALFLFERPPALDMAEPGAARRLPLWLSPRTGAG